MPDARTFVTEFQAKNQAAAERLVSAFRGAIEKESFEVVDLLRLLSKSALETAEVAALWLVDCDDLALKIALCSICGDRARQLRALGARLKDLAGGQPQPDPRDGGYSKLFGYLRGLQTTEERAGAGLVTAGGFSLLKLAASAERLSALGDAETRALFEGQLVDDERVAIEAGLAALTAAAQDEESQARARRAGFRTMDLIAETIEPLQLRKAVGKKR
jgi:hypothetical protein